MRLVWADMSRDRLPIPIRKECSTMTSIRILGIDLAVTAAHRAIVLDLPTNQYLSPVLSFHATPAEMDVVIAAVVEGAAPDVQRVAVLEATGMAWFTIGVYLIRHGFTVFRVNGRQTADQRKVFQRHAKSDRIDARILARLYLTAPDQLTPLLLPSPAHLELQRTCREVNRLTHSISASKNRLRAVDDYAWLGLKSIFSPYSPQAFWMRAHWYDPARVVAAGVAEISHAWQMSQPNTQDDFAWISALVEQAQRVLNFYGLPLPIDYEGLQASLTREQGRLSLAVAQRHYLRLKTIRPLYRQLHPSRYLESLPGVAQDSAAVYIAWTYPISRFSSANAFLGWSGLIPFSHQSGNCQAKGLHITQAGPDLIKTTAFLDASVARLYDPQIAAIYYDQMMIKGKHHNQAICACATHLLSRLYATLKNDRPYILRDVDGTPLSKDQARFICQTRYVVPAAVRQRNNARVRRKRTDDRLEKLSSRRDKQRSKG